MSNSGRRFENSDNLTSWVMLLAGPFFTRGLPGAGPTKLTNRGHNNLTQDLSLTSR